MKKVFFVFALGLLLLIEVSAVAQDDLWKSLFTITGLDEEVGMVGMYTSDSTSTWDDSCIVEANYGLDATPIYINPQPQGIVYLPSGRIQLGTLGISLEEFKAQGESSISGSVPGVEATDIYNSDTDQAVSRFSVGVVNMFDYYFYSSWISVVNDENWSYYPDKVETVYNASRAFNISSYALRFDANILPNVKGIAGVGYQNWGLEDTQSVEGTFHYEENDSGYDDYGNYWTDYWLYHDNWSLEATSNAEFTLIGADIGAQISLPLFSNHLSVIGFIDKGWVNGVVVEKGNFVDTDAVRYYEEYSDSSGSYTGEEDDTIVGTYPLRKSRNVGIDTLEIGAGIQLKLSPISIGVSYQRKIYIGIPVPSRFHYVSMYSDTGDIPRWIEGTRNVSLGLLKLEGSLEF